MSLFITECQQLISANCSLTLGSSFVEMFWPVAFGVGDETKNPKFLYIELSHAPLVWALMGPPSLGPHAPLVWALVGPPSLGPHGPRWSGP